MSNTNESTIVKIELNEKNSKIIDVSTKWIELGNTRGRVVTKLVPCRDDEYGGLLVAFVAAKRCL